MLEIVTHPNEALRRETAAVQEIDEEIKALAQEMLEAMYEYDGVGLAAPQVDRTERIFVCHVKDDEPRVFINPQIIQTSMDQARIEEGCLSVPGVYAELDRAESVEVQAFNTRGRPFNLTASGMLARVILHEIDHLNGVLLFDHLPERQRDRLLKRYEKETARAEKQAAREERESARAERSKAAR